MKCPRPTCSAKTSISLLQVTIMNKKSEDIIRKTIVYLDDRLKEIKNLNEVVPEINEAREYLELNANVIDKAPTSVKNTFETQEMQDTLSINLDNWKKTLPPSPIDPASVKTAASGVSGTASMIVFDRVNSTGLDLTPEITSWKTQYNNNYSKLQEKQKRVEEIANLLTKLDLKIKREFLDAVAKCSKVDSGIASHEDAAITMRNVLDGLQGSLFNLVRENTDVLQAKNNVKWKHIGKYLAVGGTEVNQSQFLSKKERVYRDIKGILSQIAKNEGEDPKQLLKIYYVKWLEFLYTTLNLINPIYLSNYRD